MNEWWTIVEGNQIFAYGGSVIGLLGGIYGGACGVLVPRGRGKTAVYTLAALMLLISVAGLAAGAVALAQGQPWHVLYPLLLIGGVVLLSVGPTSIMIPRMYRAAEARRLHAEELRRAS